LAIITVIRSDLFIDIRELTFLEAKLLAKRLFMRRMMGL